MRDFRQWTLLGFFFTYLVQFSFYHTVRSAQKLRWRERQAAELLALTREQELAILKAQLNPHFLFNTLNGISAMVTRDPEEARRMIARLADLLRYATDSSHLCSAGLGDLEKRLDPRRFLRVHRSAIVAVNAITHLESDGEGGYVATLKNGAQVRVSRSRTDQIRHLIV